MVKKSMRRAVLAFGLVLALGYAASASAQVTARVDRNSLVEGETLSLVLQTNNTRQSLEANLDALENDFIIIDQRSETQMSIVNGQQSAMIRKLVVLEPRRTGRLTIPALEVGNARTEPISIHVDPAPEPAPGEPEPVFIEVELKPEEGPYYVHAQVGLTVRLFYQQSLTEAGISQPEPENASVRLLDEVPFQAERAGERYRVLERHYAVFPERSGSMTIPPLVLSGRLVERGGSRLWQPSSRGRRVTVESDPITFEVLPRPDSFSGANWQPARSYRLGEQLSTDGDISVGEPVTRTIIIEAVGLEENMIAEPEWSEIPGARVYPDQPQGISRDDGEWVLGHKEFRYAVVPQSEGELVLPEVRVTWWDTVADQERVSVLPSRTINVVPGASPVPSAQAESALSAQPGESVPAPGADSGAGAYWRWLTFAFAGLWLLTLVYAARARPRENRVAKGEPEAKESEVLAEFRRACKAGDPASARQALRTWLRRFAPVRGAARSSLVDFARACSHETLAREVRQLDAAGFSPQSDKDPQSGEGWDGKGLYRAWQDWNRQRQNETPAQGARGLTELYETR